MTEDLPTRRPSPRPRRPMPGPGPAAAAGSTVVRAEVSGIRGSARRRLDAMIAEAEDGTTRGTRWGRGAFAFVPAVGASAAIAFAIAQGVLAANFNVANQPFALHVASLNGDGLGAILAAETLQKESGTSRTGVLHAGLASAKLKGLCIIVHQSVLGIGYSITVSSSGDQESDGKNLFFDITDLDSTPATLHGAILGESADEVAVNGQNLGGQPGAFGLDVTKGSVNLQNVVGTAYQAQIAGSLTLPNLSIKVRLGSVDSC